MARDSSHAVSPVLRKWRESFEIHATFCDRIANSLEQLLIEADDVPEYQRKQNDKK